MFKNCNRKNQVKSIFFEVGRKLVGISNNVNISAGKYVKNCYVTSGIALAVVNFASISSAYIKHFLPFPCIDLFQKNFFWFILIPLSFFCH